MQEGQILKDLNSKGKDRYWKNKKISNLNLADSYNKLNYQSNLVQNVTQCAEVLTFIKDPNGHLKLNQTWFCKNKLCPICNWRRSMKYSYQASCVVEKAIIKEPKAKFLFLTLTIKNVAGSGLNKALSDLTKSFDRLFKRVKVKKNLIGFLRATEVTIEKGREGYYHPHLHVLLMVKPTYFKGVDNYISASEWTELWRNSTKVDYAPIINIKSVKNKDTNVFDNQGLKKAIIETAKYPVKPINFDETSLKVIDDLYRGLYRKRQIAYGGLLKDLKIQLKLDDVENGDLIRVDETGEISQGTKIVAVWDWDRKNYYLK